MLFHRRQHAQITLDTSCVVIANMGYTVLLCFTLFKTSSLAKSIFNSY